MRRRVTSCRSGSGKNEFWNGINGSRCTEMMQKSKMTFSMKIKWCISGGEFSIFFENQGFLVRDKSSVFVADDALETSGVLGFLPGLTIGIINNNNNNTQIISNNRRKYSRQSFIFLSFSILSTYVLFWQIFYIAKVILVYMYHTYAKVLLPLAHIISDNSVPSESTYLHQKKQKKKGDPGDPKILFAE